MSHFEFAIPIQRDELLTAQPGQYHVRQLYEPSEIKSSIHDLSVAFAADRVDFIIDKFDLIFSCLVHFSAVKSSDRNQIWEIVNKGYVYLTNQLSATLEQGELDEEWRTKCLNTLKMATFLLCQLTELSEISQHPSTCLGVDRSRLPRNSSSSCASSSSTSLDQHDWEQQRLRVLSALYSALQLPLHRLWQPPVPEEEFANLVGNVCYRFLENPSVAHVRSRALRDSMFQVLATLVRHYRHSHSCSLKLVQMLQQYEHAAGVLSHGVLAVTNYCNNNNNGAGGSAGGGVSLAHQMVSELASLDADELGREGAAAARHYAEFLSQLASLAPQLVLANICLLIGRLDAEPYSMRSAVLSMLADMVVEVLTGEQLDEQQRHLRDQFLDNLYQHMHDVNAFVRTKALNLWRRLCSQRAVPLSRQREVLSRAVGRLNDKSSNVRRAALQLISAFLQVNPFAAKLPVSELESQLQSERDKLAALGGCHDDDDDDQDGTGDNHGAADTNTAADDPIATLDKARAFLVTSLQAAVSAAEFEVEMREARTELLHLLTSSSSSSASTDTDVIEMMMKQPRLIPGYSRRCADNTTTAPSDGQNENQPAATTADTALSLDELVPVLNALADAQTVAAEAANTGDAARLAQVNKQKMVVLYFQDSVEFARIVDSSIAKVCAFLRSSQITDVLEAISFFVTAYEFGVLRAMDGVRRMLALIWSRENSVKEAVVAAYTRLYVPNTDSRKVRAAGLVDNLSALCVDASPGELASLGRLVSQLHEHLDQLAVQLLWQRLTRPLTAGPGSNSNGSLQQELSNKRAALALITMAAEHEASIVSTNIDVLIEHGLRQKHLASTIADTGDDNTQTVANRLDLRTVQFTCAALLKMAPTRPSTDTDAPAKRLSAEHELFSALADVMVKTVHECDDPHYTNMAQTAINVIYLLCDRPDPVMCGVVRRLATACSSPHHSQSGHKQSPARDSARLARFLAVCGHAALAHLNYLDVHVFCELKRRNRLRERAATSKSRSAAGGGAVTDTPSSASETPRNKRLSQDAGGGSGEDENGMAGAAADDADAEYISDLCEHHVVNGGGILASVLPLLVEINSCPERYGDKRVRAAAALALCKYMTVSSVVCEQNLQLLFTVLVRCDDASIRSNIIVALGDLSFRFPNLIEPWTPRIYSKLQDESVCVRRTTLTVLTHLILNDMVKVKGQISDLAVCVVDPVEVIRVKARWFFASLATKGNCLYNVMADIISRLSDAEVGVCEADFQTILRYILSLIQKDRQLESLVEKLCVRMRTAANARQWRDLVFCMTLLNYSDRCVRKLCDNFGCFIGKLHEKEVYEAVVKIIANAKKAVKSPECRGLLDELSGRLAEARDKAVDEASTTAAASKVSATNDHVTNDHTISDHPTNDHTTNEDQLDIVCETENDVRSLREEAVRLTPRRSAFSAHRLRQTRRTITAQQSTSPTHSAAGDDDDDGGENNSADEDLVAPVVAKVTPLKTGKRNKTQSTRQTRAIIAAAADDDFEQADVQRRASTRNTRSRRAH